MYQVSKCEKVREYKKDKMRHENQKQSEIESQRHKKDIINGSKVYFVYEMMKIVEEDHLK